MGVRFITENHAQSKSMVNNMEKKLSAGEEIPKAPQPALQLFDS